MKFIGLYLLFLSVSLCVFSLPTSAKKAEIGTVIKVVDGDTVEVETKSKHLKVRVLGIDAPESVHPDQQKNSKAGKESSAFLHLILQGKTVQLWLDPVADATDKYARNLRYITCNGLDIGLAMLLLGYAQVYPRFPFAAKEEYLQAQAIFDAKEKKK